MGRVREEKTRRKKIKKRKSPKKEDPGARKGRKVAKHCVFPMICGSGGSKSRLAKAAGAESCGQMIDEKLHAVVARSTFASEKTKSTSHHLTFGTLLEAEMSKKCTPLWREAHVEVKMHKLSGWFWFSILVCTCKYCYNQVISYCKFPKSAKFLSFFRSHSTYLKELVTCMFCNYFLLTDFLQK